MNLEALVLCDAATDTAGKLNVLGAFDSIVVKSLPSVHAHCAVALRIRFSHVEAGKHKVRINLVDEDGHPVVPPLDAEVNVAIKGQESSVALNMVMNIQRLQIKKIGEYSVDVAIDESHEKSIPLTIRMLEQKPPDGS